MKRDIWLITWLLASLPAWSQLPLHPERGIVVQWEAEQALPDSNSLGTDVIQVDFTWRELESETETYHFDRVDKVLAKANEAGLKAFVKVRTDLHPDYIFEIAPYLKGFSIEGLSDHERGYGMPMFWYKTYKDRYARLLYELGSHFMNATYSSSVLGIIPDVRETGADNLSEPDILGDPSRWVIPNGTSSLELPVWDENTWNEHMNWLHRVHSRAGSGALWLYQEHTAPQPGNKDREVISSYFKKSCSEGFAYGYSETGSPQPGMSVTDEMFIHWTVLFNLYCGASFLALPPEYTGDPVFAEDLDFFRKYSGYLPYPGSVPGIWIAFREGETLPGDYAFLMERNRILESEALENAGNDSYGLWARRIDSTQTIRLKMDHDFIESLDPSRKLTIRVWYLDDNRAVFRIHAFGGIHAIPKTGTGLWKVAEINRRARIKSQLLDVVALDGPLTVHMVEIAR